MLDTTSSNIDQSQKMIPGLFDLKRQTIPRKDRSGPHKNRNFPLNPSPTQPVPQPDGYLRDSIQIQICITGIISIIIGGIIITMLVLSASSALPQLGLIVCSHIAAALVGILGGVFMHMTLLYMKETQTRRPTDNDKKTGPEQPAKSGFFFNE